MTWFKLDDAFHNHPKVHRAGNAAVGLWVRCATYSAQYDLDGRIPAGVVESYGRPREIDAVTASGLWVANGSEFVIPDYLEFNMSAEEVRDMRAKRAEAGRKGGLTRSRGQANA